MGVRFIFGRGGSGKSTYVLNEIKKEFKMMKLLQL